jgi:GNAT superfamily N-acetyltransferase
VVVKRLDDPAAFLASAETLLLTDEARHNLMLGIAGSLRDHPGLYLEFRGWMVELDGGVVGAALQTPPYNLVVGRPSEAGAVEALAGAIWAEGVGLPGVTAAVPEVDDFSGAWLTRAGLRRRARMRQRIYRLTGVHPVHGVSGHARPATAADRPLLLAWVHAFAEESFADVDPKAAARQVDARLDRGAGGFSFWEDAGEPVSLVGWGGATPNGVRVGPVYTPPGLRRRGYATALTAAVSADQLAAGKRFCFLYTDLENPTSNRIYMSIGYEPVCDSVDYVFEPPSAVRVSAEALESSRDRRAAAAVGLRRPRGE